jgi:hypothetical protein
MVGKPEGKRPLGRPRRFSPSFLPSSLYIYTHIEHAATSKYRGFMRITMFLFYFSESEAWVKHY